MGVGGANALLAWDRYDRGPSAADDIDLDGVGLYSWIGLTSGEFLTKMKTKSPISIPEEYCPVYPDGFPQDYFNWFEVKPGGTTFASIVDFAFKVYEGSTLIYSVAPEGESLKVELAENSFISGEDGMSVQDRPTLQPWEDPPENLPTGLSGAIDSREIWRDLMTPNQPLNWF